MSVWVVIQNDAPIAYTRIKAAAERMVARKKEEYREASRHYHENRGRRSEENREKFYFNWGIDNPPPIPPQIERPVFDLARKHDAAYKARHRRAMKALNPIRAEYDARLAEYYARRRDAWLAATWIPYPHEHQYSIRRVELLVE